MKKKVYIVIKEEAYQGADAINVYMVTADYEKALRKFNRLVREDKAKNPLWKTCRCDLFDDEPGYYYVYDFNGRLQNHTHISIIESSLT